MVCSNLNIVCKVYYAHVGGLLAKDGYCLIWLWFVMLAYSCLCNFGISLVMVF